MNSKSKNTVARRVPEGNQNRTIPTPRYDPAWLGKPYMARLRWNDDGSLECDWYIWHGKEGEPGRFELSFNAGDVFMAGQKPRGEYQKSTPRYYLALPGGKLRQITSRAHAQELYWANLNAEAAQIPEEEARPLARLSDGELKARYDEVKAEIQMRRAERGLA